MMKSFITTKSFTSIRYFGTTRKTAGQPVIRCRHPIMESMATQYTINDDVCPPMDPADLAKIVQKHCSTLDIFLEHRPIAKHTQAAFDQILPYVDANKKVILDSGCGTARSTLLLGELFPDHTVIGIDRSLVRLNRNALSSTKGKREAKDDTDKQSMSNAPSEENQRPFQVISSNTILVRAELTDFWRCCLKSEWDISHHFIYYPNPYPKKNRVKKRFYAHPSFPLILQIGGKLTLRSNWEGYLKEFAQSVKYAHELYATDSMENHAQLYLKDATNGPVERTDKSIAFTNFEKKFDDVGEKTYELQLRRQ